MRHTGRSAGARALRSPAAQVGRCGAGAAAGLQLGPFNPLGLQPHRL